MTAVRKKTKCNLDMLTGAAGANEMMSNANKILMAGLANLYRYLAGDVDDKVADYIMRDALIDMNDKVRQIEKEIKDSSSDALSLAGRWLLTSIAAIAFHGMSKINKSNNKLSSIEDIFKYILLSDVIHTGMNKRSNTMPLLLQKPEITKPIAPTPIRNDQGEYINMSMT